MVSQGKVRLRRPYGAGLRDLLHCSRSIGGGAPSWRAERLFLTVLVAALGVVSMGVLSRRTCDVSGTVLDATPDLSPETWAAFERAALGIRTHSKYSSKEWDALWSEIASAGPALSLPGVVVTLESPTLALKTVTDSQGRYRFERVPQGFYDIWATAPVRPPSGKGARRVVTAQERFEVYGSRDLTVDLSLHGEAITLRGRIMDAQGNPIEGANVRGESYPIPDDRAVPPTRYAVSDAGGFYELSGFVPMAPWDIARYLAGDNMVPPGVDNFWDYHFYVDIYAEAEGFGQAQHNVPRVPLITEELIGPARSFLKAQLHVNALGRGRPKPEVVETIPPYASAGNTITGIEIMLD